MFLVDDLILRALGLSMKPFDLIWLLELMRDYSLKEKYNIKKINNQIKENVLLFEMGEITYEEYEEIYRKLLEELQEAKEITEKLSEVKIAEGI